ncbi:MAG: hypothetical protein DMG64_12645 [Acidobacteria bacterium]|nr:MAG: hypothetical protein DMG64_12645 [Acidobacteriota bacterium]PYY23327.1 MAG: hypothetical protein DMG62_09570 [Acidobacteriota bacterium]
MTTESGIRERRYTRVQLPISAEVCGESGSHLPRPAHLRDISAGGAFFYAEFEPKVGTVLQVNFVVPGIGSDVQISCEGRVVRVETESIGAQIGIAVAFDRLNLGPL